MLVFMLGLPPFYGQSSALAARVILQLLLVVAASRPRAGGSLSFDSASLPRSKWQPPGELLPGGGFRRRDKKNTNKDP